MMIWIRVGGWIMFLGVLLGAFGAHALREKLSAYHMDVFKTGVFYHFVHGLGLFLVAYLSTQTTDSKVTWAGILFIVGIFLFSGSLYALSVTGIRWFGAITPIGGLAFMTAWALIAFLSKP